MKKTAGIVILISGIVLLAAGIISSVAGVAALLKIRSNVPSNISIIGGADGPTAVFLAGKLGLPVYVSIIAGFILLVTGIIIIARRKVRIDMNSRGVEGPGKK